MFMCMPAATILTLAKPLAVIATAFLLVGVVTRRRNSRNGNTSRAVAAGNKPKTIGISNAGPYRGPWLAACDLVGVEIAGKICTAWYAGEGPNFNNVEQPAIQFPREQYALGDPSRPIGAPYQYGGEPSPIEVSLGCMNQLRDYAEKYSPYTLDSIFALRDGG
jgi:hypothetical protein